MMTKPSMQTLIAGSILALAGGAQAADKMWTPSANVAMTTDYVWRGISQTMEDPAIQGGFDINHASGFYLGTWGSNVRYADRGDTSDGSHLEIDAYAGFGNELANGVGYDFGYLHYFYPGMDDADTGEIYLGLSFKGFGATYFYNPDNEGSHYIELGYEYGLPNDFTLGATVGYYKPEENDDGDYTNYKLSLGKSWSGFDFALDYTDTDLDDDDLADGRVVFTIGKSF